MYDIHSHILPGVDDGPSDIEESVRMACMAEQAGMDGIVCTPHYIEGRYDYGASHNLALLDSLRRLLVQRGINIKLFAGNEVFFTYDIINLLERQEIATINNSRYLLIEMPVYCKPVFMDDIIFKLRLKGLVPIVAHPERYEWIMNNSENLADLIRKGCLAQLNMSSINGFYGKSVKKASKMLLKEGLIHLLGSDSHSTDSGYRQFAKSMGLLKKTVSADMVERLIYNTRSVIDDKEIRDY